MVPIEDAITGNMNSWWEHLEKIDHVIDNLKVYQESHEKLKVEVSEAIRQWKEKD